MTEEIVKSMILQDTDWTYYIEDVLFIDGIETKTEHKHITYSNFKDRGSAEAMLDQINKTRDSK